MSELTNAQRGDSDPTQSNRTQRHETSILQHKSAAFQALHDESMAASIPRQSSNNLDRASSAQPASVKRVDAAKSSSREDLAGIVPTHLLYDKPAVPLKSFESNKSIPELAYNGAIVDRTSMRVESAAMKPQDKAATLGAAEVPTVHVALQNPAGQAAVKPDFLIKKDGKIEMFNDALKTGQKNIVVQFERSGNQVGISDAQKDVGAKFYIHLQDQLKAKYPQAQPEAFKTDDAQGVLRDTKLPPELKNNLEQQEQKKDSPQGSGLPDHAAPTMQDTRRITEGGKISIVPRHEVNDMTPAVQHLPGEAERVQAMKDTMASYVTRGEKEPYSYVSKHDDGRGWGIGRYGLTYNQMKNWLSGLSEGQTGELIKEGKLSPDQAQNLEKMRDSIHKADASGNDNDLDPALRAMKNGTGSADDMRNAVRHFFPDKVQELAASDQIARTTCELARDAIARGLDPAINPGQVALSMVLGRTIGKEEYMSTPAYKNFVESATQGYRLQEQSRIQNGDSLNIENMSQVSNKLNHMVGQQFWREAAAVTEYGNLGCAIAVTRMLQHMGVNIGAHLDVNGTENDMRRRHWREVSIEQAMRSGQLFVAIEPGQHTGLGMRSQVWENSSSRARVVTGNMYNSGLINSARAYIVPLHLQEQRHYAPIPEA